MNLHWLYVQPTNQPGGQTKRSLQGFKDPTTNQPTFGWLPSGEYSPPAN